MPFKTKNAEILKTAAGLNYWGKKLETKRREVAGKIADQFTNGQRVGEIMDYLDANKPVKEKPAKAAAAPVEPAFNHTSHHYDNAPRLDGDRPAIVYAVQNNASIVGQLWTRSAVWPMN